MYRATILPSRSTSRWSPGVSWKAKPSAARAGAERAMIATASANRVRENTGGSCEGRVRNACNASIGNGQKLSSAEFLPRHLRDRAADADRRRRRRGWRIQDVNHPLRLPDEEVVHELAGSLDCLRAHPGPGG